MSIKEELANMSRARRFALGGAAFVGVGLLATGVLLATAPTPPGLPTTAQEAASVLAGDRFALLDDERQRQYLAETRRLIGALSEEERRAMFEDEALRRALRDARRDAMDERAREFARTGEMPERPEGGGRGGPGGEQRRERFENMSEDEREQFIEERRSEARDQVAQDTASGNAQSTGLQQEMRKRMQQQRQQGGGGSRRGGGGE